MSHHETKRGGLHVGPNMTPMVDVVMCILIFFMLGSSFVVADLSLAHRTPAEKGPCPTPGVMPDQLPAVQCTLRVSSVAGRARVVAFGVTVDNLDGPGDVNSLALSRLLEAKRATLGADTQLTLAIDRNVRYQDAITIYDACVKARFERVAFTVAH